MLWLPTMEVDMSASTDTFRVTRSKRARSPTSPDPNQRRLKRPSLGPNACLPMPPTRTRYGSEDWVKQTRTLSIDAPLAVQGAAFIGAQGVATIPGAVRGGDQMMDTAMFDEDVAMTSSPPRPRVGIDAHSEPSMPLQEPTLIGPVPPSAPDASITSPNPQQSAPRRQKFTMGPRSDCEKCRLGVKGHWAHYD
ncbi:hypothetical protein C8Q72DRAFT_801061 [Fomitopsis betulina]|nr:hypothetical protein C8Q72DRAFT_801061 [Fomitopsis betulina]